MTQNDPQTAPQEPVPVLDSAQSLLSDYQAAIVDLWGVVHNGVAAHPGAIETLTNLRTAGRTVLLLSNAPRVNSSVIAQLDRLGVPHSAYDEVLTSGDLTREAIAGGGFGKTFVHVGPERDRGTFEGLALEEGDIDNADFMLCTGLFDDTTETPDDYQDLLALAKARDIPMVCANPDLIVQRGSDLIYCAGAIAQAYRKMGGAAVLYGKPEERTYRAAFDRVAKLRGEVLGKDQIIMIGDGLKTDITGAQKAGIDALLIAGGIHGKELGLREDKPLDGARVARVLAELDLSAKAVMPQLLW